MIADREFVFVEAAAVHKRARRTVEVGDDRVATGTQTELGMAPRNRWITQDHVAFGIPSDDDFAGNRDSIGGGAVDEHRGGRFGPGGTGIFERRRRTQTK